MTKLMLASMFALSTLVWSVILFCLYAWRASRKTARRERADQDAWTRHITTELPVVHDTRPMW